MGESATVRDNPLDVLVRIIRSLGMEHAEGIVGGQRVVVFMDGSGEWHMCRKAGSEDVSVTMRLSPYQAVCVDEAFPCYECEAMNDCFECLRADTSHKRVHELEAVNNGLAELCSDMFETLRRLAARTGDPKEMVHITNLYGFAKTLGIDEDDMRELGVEVDA